MTIFEKLEEQGVNEKLIKDVECFRKEYLVAENLKDRIPKCETIFYGKDIWSMCITAILEGENILLRLFLHLLLLRILFFLTNALFLQIMYHFHSI